MLIFKNSGLFQCEIFKKLSSSFVLLMIIAVLGFCVSACGGGGSGNTNAPASPSTPIPGPSNGSLLLPKGVWVVMGSSTAAGVGATLGKRWSDILQDTFFGNGAVIENIAKGGTVTYQALSASTAPISNRPAPDPTINIDRALSLKPVVLILSYPTNDIMAGYSIDEVIVNLTTLRTAGLNAGAKVLLMSTQPRNINAEKLLQLRQIDERLAALAGGCFVNVHSVLAGPDDHLAPIYDSGDGIHPNDEGHRKISEKLATVIRSGSCFSL